MQKSKKPLPKRLLNSRKRVTKKKPEPIKAPIIPSLEHAPFVDKAVAFFVKPAIIGALYAGKTFTGWLRRRWGFNSNDYNGEIMLEALDKATEGKETAKLFLNWAMSIIINICIIDGAYNRLLRKFLYYYMKTCEKYKYNPFKQGDEK